MDPSFPTDSKAGQTGLKTCVSARINLAALIQVSKLSPANGELNSPKYTVPLASTQAVYKALHSTVRWNRMERTLTHGDRHIGRLIIQHSSSSRKSQSVRLEHSTVEPVAASCTYASAINASKCIQCICCVQT